MSEEHNQIEYFSESDVEQKFVYELLTKQEPLGLGYSASDFRTKIDIRSLEIDKGTKKKLYYPDYAVIINGLPVIIIEAKTPNEDVVEATRQARLYATEINSTYPKNINPCERLIVTDGHTLVANYWDEDTPHVQIKSDNFDSLHPEFAKFISFCSKRTVINRSNELLGSIKKTARYFKPIFMLGGKSVMNETVGDNSFGSNVSVEYKYLFNPSTAEERASVVNNAYIKSKRKQSHIAPIDRIIRAAIPVHMSDALKIEDTGQPDILTEQLLNPEKLTNEICLLIGSVGSGKSTFTDYLRLEALPAEIRNTTEWINLNLNEAPLSKDIIYNWIVNHSISKLKELHSDTDFDHINIIMELYKEEIDKVKKGRAALYPKDSEKYIDAIYYVIDSLQADNISVLKSMVNYLYKNKLLIIVLDNCDKRNRDDQLLMFEVASWIKNTFSCMVFLPIRDTTYDQYRNEPPLDTVIQDLVFRIDPPLLERVIYARLNYALREIKDQNTNFEYYLPNNIKVSCSRSDVSRYLRTIVSSLFQDQLFKRIIVGVAGRNIRKGLEIILDFCKSGHIPEGEILKIRQSDGDYKLPNHLIIKTLLKGKRKYYSDEESHIKNLLSSDSEDSLPDPFVRISILEWLKLRFREYGPNRIKGYHHVESVLRALQAYGHSSSRITKELSSLIRAGCVNSESQSYEIFPNDLVSIAPSGFVHLELLKNINYLSTVSEDTFFRESEVAKNISNNLIGRGKFKSDSRQSAIGNSKLLMNYMDSYHDNFFVGSAHILKESRVENLLPIKDVTRYVNQVAENDSRFSSVHKLEEEYPAGSHVESQISSIQSYGFFVEFGLNGAGLIHKSMLLNGTSLDDYEVGDWVIVEIKGFNTARGRFDLLFVDDYDL